MDYMTTTRVIPSYGKAVICRFCGTPSLVDISPDNTVNKWILGYVEVDEDLLKETFDVQLSKHMNISKMICTECSTKLREAHSFKQLVVNTEQKLWEYYKGKVESEEPTTAEDEYKADKIKVEELCSEDTVQDDMDDQSQVEEMPLDEHRADDDETLTTIKCEPPTKHKVDRKKRKYQAKKQSDKLLLEIRGTGPLLRENSLKLIANSTICVFQWEKSRYRCFCCKEPYSDMNLLREHMKIHTLSDIEKTIIARENNLIKAEVSQLFCKICNSQVDNLTELKKHLTNHGVSFSESIQKDLLVPFRIDKVLTCQICSETFSLFRVLNIHMNKHFQSHICHICGAGFSTLKYVNSHRYHSHSLKCKKCDLAFTNRIDKREHDVKVHRLIKPRRLRYPCRYCDERFKDDHLRVLHLVEKHNYEKPEHKCNICAKQFLTQGLCNSHIRAVHFKEKKYQCDVCNHLFYTKTDLVRHEVTHTGEKKYSCNVCSTMFATKDSLRRHSKRAHN